jgi:HEAT repeat protein
VLGLVGEPDAGATLLELTQDPSDQVRAAAVEALGRVGLARAVQPLVERALRDPTPHVRAQAAAALGRMGAANAVDALTVAFDDPSYDTRLRAVEAIEAIRPSDLSPLERALRNPSREVRQRAGLALERVGFVDATARELASENDVNRTRAHEVLVQVGKVGIIDGLTGLLASKDPTVRGRVARVLADVGDARSAPGLRAACSDEVVEVRAAAADGLARCAPSAAAEVIAPMLVDPSTPVAEAAASALEGLDADALAGALPAVWGAFRHRSPRVRASAVRIATRLDPSPSGELVRPVLDDPDDTVRALALGLVPRVFEPSWMDLLTARLTDPAEAAQLAAVDVLVALPSTTDATERLLQSLATASPVLRERIASALANVDPTTIEERLRPLVRSPDLNVRLGIAWTLGKIGAPRGVGILAELLVDDEATLRASVAGALAKIATAGSADLLASATSDREPRVRAAAVNGLGRLEELARPHHSVLAARMSDPDAFVRNRAAIAIARVGQSRANELLAQAESRGFVDAGPLHIALALEGSDASKKRVAAALGTHGLGETIRAQLRGEDEVVRRRFHAALRLADPAGGPGDGLDTDQMLAHYNRRLRISQSAQSREWAVHALTRLPRDERVEPLADALASDPAVTVRERAIEALASMLDREAARRAIVRAIGDPEAAIARRAVALAGTIGDRASIDALFERLGATDSDLQGTIVEALADTARREPQALVSRLQGEARPNVLAAATEVLARGGNAAAFAALRELFRSDHPEVRAAAIRALGAMKTSGLDDEVVLALRDPDELVRAAAIDAMARRGVGAALPRIADARMDPSVQVRRALARSLGSLFASADFDVRRAIATALSTDPDINVRGTLLASLVESTDEEAHALFLRWLDPRQFDLRRATATDVRADDLSRTLVARLQNASAISRRAAALALGTLRPANWGDVLSALAADPAPEVRITVAAELAAHGDPSIRAVVDRLASDPDARVRAAAQGQRGAVALGA